MKPDIVDEYAQLKKDIAEVINRHSYENRSNTPDYMLAEYMLGCLTVYENTIKSRESWNDKQQDNGEVTDDQEREPTHIEQSYNDDGIPLVGR